MAADRAKSLVTGGAGFIGSHVARHCLDLGHEVIAFDDLSGGFADHVPEGARLVHGSVTDGDAVDRLFEEHTFDYVYHLAAYAAEGLSHHIRHFNYVNNVLGSVNLINAAVRHEVRCFVFTSSIAVYGSGHLPMTEELDPRPENPYGIAKFAVELDLKAAHDTFGLDHVIFRPHNVYGAHQNIGDRYRNVIGIFMRQAMLGESLTIFGDGTQTRAFSHIDDVAPAIARSVTLPEASNQIINLGADTPHSVLELAEVVSRAIGVELRVEHLEARQERRHAYASHDKARRIFGEYRPVGLEEGVFRMAQWAKRVGPRQGQAFENIELERGLPRAWRE